MASSDNKASNWMMGVLISRERGWTSIFKVVHYFDSMCLAIGEVPL